MLTNRIRVYVLVTPSDASCSRLFPVFVVEAMTKSNLGCGVAYLDGTVLITVYH